MTFEELKVKFRERMLEVGLEELPMAISTNVSEIRRIPCHSLTSACAAIEGMAPQERDLLASALPKRFHSEAAARIGKELSDGERTALDAYGRRLREISHLYPSNSPSLTSNRRKVFRQRLYESLTANLGGERKVAPGIFVFRTESDGVRLNTHVDTAGRTQDVRVGHRVGVGEHKHALDRWGFSYVAVIGIVADVDLICRDESDEGIEECIGAVNDFCKLSRESLRRVLAPLGSPIVVAPENL